MVSTRGPKYKFSEGEKVLCYEPDPTKAKVLYDSKVLQVVKTKDKRGRPAVEYLIHFQGWNSSWDRCVGEDFVLKDTEENRQLQRSLAEKSQLQFGAYLYRRERKKTTGNSGSTSNIASIVTEKRNRKRGLECEGSSSSGDQEEHDERDSDTSSRSDSSCLTADEQKPETTSEPQTSVANATINLRSGIKERLIFDFHVVMKEGRVSMLPAKPTVLDILEGCVKQYAAKEAAAKHRQRRSRASNPTQPQEHLAEFMNKLNLLHEIADGIRIYFDYLLNSHLLYKPEFMQYNEAVSKNIIKEVRSVSETEQLNNAKCGLKIENQSPLEEYAHLPPSPKLDESSNQREHNNAPSRRLRSHKLSHASETYEELPSSTALTNAIPGPSNMEPSSSSVSDSPGHSEIPSLGSDLNGGIAETIQKTLSWHIVPPDHPPFPSAIYGATHLARLFVKLPEFLSAINMAEMKLKLIIKYVEIFVDYLEEHDEWFGETCYVSSNNTS
ncbi:male-specific lethal 3 [Arctopsyche grandis]|uniref:male-specific lethal 3 n=1 Tax=Arctopsyche grandis TaxID=121162 RepID=UPI00406D83E6